MTSSLVLSRYRGLCVIKLIKKGWPGLSQFYKTLQMTMLIILSNKSFFSTQKDFPTKGDWTLQIEEDKKELDINNSETEIKCMKKHSFKKLVKSKLKEKAMEFLFNLKNKENRSKSKRLNYYTFQNYLQSSELSTNEKKLLFSLRTRSVYFIYLFIETQAITCQM